MKKLIISFLFTLTTNAFAAEVALSTIKAQGGTGFQINDIRNFEVTEDTLYMEDGETIPAIMAQGGTGYKVRYKVSNTSPNLTTGVLDEIDLISIYKGPLLSTSPLKVFNISGLVNSQTYFANNLSLDDLVPGNTVVVSGFIDNESVAVITRIELVNELAEWKLSGFVDNLTANQFSINNQTINYSPNVVGSCNSSLANGDFVEVFAQPVVNFELNDNLDSVTQINCVDRSVVPNHDSGTVIIEGMIDALNVNNGFVLAGQNVEVSRKTRYVRGRPEDIQEGIKIEVEGTADNVSGTVSANSVRFTGARINLTMPVAPNNFNSPVLNVAGVALQVTPQTLDPDGVIAGGFNATKQLQLRGYSLAASELYVTRINERGSVDYGDVSIEGEISALDQPIVELFGIKVDTLDSLFYDDKGLAINANDFFAMVSNGSKVLVKNGTLNPESGLVSGGELIIKTLISKTIIQSGSSVKVGGEQVFGVGHITSLPDGIFKAEFEN